MKYPNLHLIVYVFTLVFLSSCQKDQDLFTQAIEDNIQEEIISEENSEEENVSDEQDSNGDVVTDPGFATELKAFPTAYGAGAYAEGFRGGQVIHVTSLEDNYNNVQEGTWRWAITRDYPRIIVFDVSGEIKLSGRIVLNSRNSNVYIAGQTSPNGIMISGYSHYWSGANEVVLRHMKFYGDPSRRIAPNDPSSARRQLLQFVSPSNVIVDHCDFVFNDNEAINFYSSERTVAGGATLQNCIIGEGDTGVLMAGDECNTTLFGEYSAIRNLFVHISHRVPNFSANVKGESINNIIYNSRARLSRVSCTAQANFYGNYYKAGPATYFSLANRINLVRDDDGASVYIDNTYWSFMTGKVESSSDTATDIFNAAESGTNVAKTSQPPVSSWSLSSPVEISGLRPEIMQNNVAFDYVLTNSGARQYLNANGAAPVLYDSKQQQYFDDVIYGGNTNGSGSDYGFDMGVYDPPVINQVSRSSSYDTDLDGMPDEWEIANGFNPDVDDSAGDMDGDGYTNIEEFLNLVDF
ncbi:hypothetical protein [Flagellimonas okinawensis]|uniref:Pectate lyase n=1 Tax=Flagellimonas okinawensis TaxID=3031324 RepID=A0ABT5XRX4_9FLAO|nr:hypothetical protein [[Muricauda] okinawensis]MDF0708341.1 hypothetical protein [[Muricauda] okinawensis]